LAAAGAALCAALAAIALSRIAGLGGSGNGAASCPEPVETRLPASTTVGA